jgi:hypothetical protein
MDFTTIFLLVLLMILLFIMVFLMLNPTFQIISYPVMPKPRHMMPQFGSYWVHGGQTNSKLLY